HSGSDGVATFDLITAQPWSNGRVGTLGCSALGEAQLMLAAQAHPAHRAMVPIAAGGAIGSLDGSHSYFSTFEGGVFGLATGAGWFGEQGGKTPARSGAIPTDPARALPHLPLIDVVRQMRSDSTDYEAFLMSFENSDFWRNAGYVTGAEPFATPALFIDTWHDPGIRSTLQLAQAVAQKAVETRTIIAAGTHCGYLGSDQDTLVGDLAVEFEVPFGFVETIISFLSQHLADGPALELPELSYFSLVENKWRGASDWPPKGAEEVSFYLSEGQVLDSQHPTEETQAWQFRSDPMNPVPSVGGALCCTGDPDALEGPVFQNSIEGRDDLLLFTSAPLKNLLLLAGPIRATLQVSADVLDTDLVLRLTDVDPQGRSLLLQEGALRMRYRAGVEHPELMEPGQTYGVTIEMRDIAYLLRAGHRLRLHVAGSSFPRLERNLNTGGANWDETQGISANITIHSDAARPSSVTVYVLDE
ncbi:CocE/NonD family hydrolase, partial [Falsihalocynthiibacter sp. BN13B15]|uniref:CocE/NonD family hydrolase n=1 Tax=Falsihalocynthiibacter sp. BN13B15 TaxID=3240871 RepID=UPI00350F6732